MSDVVALKLVSGDEIVAELKSARFEAEKVTVYTLKRPHLLKFQDMGRGQVGLAFIPYTLSNPTIETIDLPGSAVMFTFSPSGQVEKQYLEQTSGIALATNSSRISS